MKFLGVLLFGMCLCTHASTFSQSKVTMDMKGVSLKSIFTELGKQTQMDFFYNANLIQAKGKVNVSVKDKELKQLLDELLPELGLEYSFDDEIVIIREKLSQQQKEYKVEGVVKDKKGETLPGVTLILKGTSIGTATTNEGKFSLSLPIEKGELVFSSIGFKTQTVDFESGKILDVVLEDEVSDLDEIVVTGLVTHRKNSFTGNAKVVRGDELRTMGNKNIIKSLSLIDPSLGLVENNEMGSNPNAMPKIRFRGESQFQGFENIDQSGLIGDPNLPLFILDGYQTTLETIIDLDMNRVESVTLLKDAAAGAIYGSRAANGVIVVRTIQPLEGEMRISYNLDLDFNFPDLRSYNLLNARENLELYDRLWMYRNYDGSLEPQYYQITRWVAEGVDTDWLSKPVRNVTGHKHSLSLAGGDNRMRYSMVINYSDDPGVMKKSFRQNIGMGVLLSYNLDDKVLFSNNLSFNKNKQQESPYGDFSDYTLINSFYPIYDENGKLYKYYGYEDEYGSQSYTWGNGNVPVNPLYEASVGNKNKQSYLNLTNNFSFDWLILPELRLNGRFSYSHNANQSDVFVSPNSSVYPTYSGNMDPNSVDEVNKGSYSYSETKQESFETNIVLTYSKEFTGHFITSSIGGSLSDSKSKVYGFVAKGFGSEDAGEPAFANGYEIGGVPKNSYGQARLASFFFSANYSYHNRYLFDFSYRLDGSSQFGSKEKSAPFYAFGLGWNVHHERFLKDNSIVNHLKLRGTIGETGSVNFAPYQARDMYEMTTNDRYDGNVGVVLLALGNENLRWQNTLTKELGIDLKLFNRVDISGSYYVKTTSDMVLPVTTPPSVGFDSFTENLGKMENKGYDVSVRGMIFKGKDLNVSLYATGSHNRNRIKSISSSLESYNKSTDSREGYENNENGYKQASHKFLVRYEEGKSSTAIYAVRSLGIDPISGKEFFLTKDGVPTLEWKAEDKVVVGDTEPDLRGTLGMNVGWKNLFFNMTFSYTFGGQAYNNTIVEKVENSNKFKNVDKRVLTETWQKVGDVVRYKANKTTRLTSEYTYASSRFVQDLNTLQLSTMSLQYEMPRTVTSLLHMQSLRFSFNMSDIFYWSTVKRERGTSYPFARSFTLGLRANF